MLLASDRAFRHLPTAAHRMIRRTATDANDEGARYRWYDVSCPCGRPLGECRDHPRARDTQRPPDGDWRCWLLMAGRAHGKTRTGAEWVLSLVESGQAR